MIIDIISGNAQEDGYKIFEYGKEYPFRNIRKNTIRLYDFDEDDIFNLLGEKEYKKFEEGKYHFTVPKSRIDLITGQRSARTKEELKMYND